MSCHENGLIPHPVIMERGGKENYMKYSVKMLIRYAVESGEVFIEESIIMLEANSFDDAYLKAEKYVRDNEIDKSYENMYGKSVESKVVSFTDCFSIYDEEDVIEVYSSIIKCRNDLPEDSVIAFFEENCDRQDLLPLRQYPDPDHPEEVV